MAIPTAGELGAIFSGIPDSFILIGAGLLAVGYYAYTRVDTRAFEKYEQRPLGEKVVEDLQFRLKKIGKRTDKTLYSKTDMEEKDQIGFYDTYEIEDEKPVLPNTGLKADEGETKEVYVFMTAPDKDGIIGWLKYFSWFIKDYIHADGESTFYIMNKESVEIREHNFVYGEDVQFLPTSYTGVNSNIMCQSTTRSANVVNQIATADMEGQMLNSMTEFLGKVEHFEIEHLKKMEEMDKEAEIEKERQEGLID